jgi:hypothetical protein
VCGVVEVAKEMTRTALALTAEEWRAYRPGVETDEEQVARRWERAWEVARTAAGLLRQEFGATRVVFLGPWHTGRGSRPGRI